MPPSAPPAPVSTEPPAREAPAPAPLQLPEGMTLGKYMWPSIWPFWGMPLRRFAKVKWPGKRGLIAAMSVADIFTIIVLFIPRLLGLFWVGLILWVVKKLKKRRQARAAQALPVATGAD